MDIIETLRVDPEPYPRWLQFSSPKFNRSDFFGSRTVYYPGSGFDGQPVKFSSMAHFAHAFVYVDYGVSQEEIEDRVSEFSGYSVKCTETVQKTSLRPGGWEPHIERANKPGLSYSFASAEPFAWFVVMKRDDEVDETHGPKRLAVLFIGGDGHATYDALYCQQDGTPAPYLIMIQDHGFGGNYSSFGEGGILSEIARNCDVLPEWLLVGRPSRAWLGYDNTGAEPQPGGMNAQPRELFLRNGSPVWQNL